jgi:3-oxoacyl-[acyl-carrier-protein] synthase-3
MSAYIKALDYYLPEKILTNEEIVKEFPEWSVDKIAKKVGVTCRHIAADHETALDMAVKDANNLFSNQEDLRANIDFIIFCTQSPDYKLPTSACIIQERLGLSTSIGAFDYNLGCSGYIYGLAIAKGFIAANIAKNVLLLTAETYSKYLHEKDKGNKTIFGDAASATVISTEGFCKIGEFSLGTDGQGSNNLIVRSGMSRVPNEVHDLKYDDSGNPISSDHLFMNGSEIFSFTQHNVPIVVNEALAKNELSKDDIALYIFHQANSYMLNFLRKKLKIAEDHFLIDMEDVGNTVSNSIPIALKRALNNQKIKVLDKVLLCGFGVGYSWGSAVLDFK